MHLQLLSLAVLPDSSLNGNSSPGWPYVACLMTGRSECGEKYNTVNIVRSLIEYRENKATQ